MAISHADHDHPATPAARAACRKQMRADSFPIMTNVEVVEKMGPVKPARLVGVAKANGKGFRAFAIRNEGDLADGVPHVFSGAIRKAWDEGWVVRSAHPYNDTEKRVEVKSDHGTVTLVYKAGNERVWGVFWRAHNETITHRIEAAEVGIVNEAIRRLAEGV